MHTADLYRISLGQGSSVVNASLLTTALCVEKEQKPCILVMNSAGCLSNEGYSGSTGQSTNDFGCEVVNHRQSTSQMEKLAMALTRNS